MPLVEEYKEQLARLGPDQSGGLVLEKGYDLQDLHHAGQGHGGIAEPPHPVLLRDEEGTVSFYPERPCGRRPKGEAATGPRRPGRLGRGV